MSSMLVWVGYRDPQNRKTNSWDCSSVGGVLARRPKNLGSMSHIYLLNQMWWQKPVISWAWPGEEGKAKLANFFVRVVGGNDQRWTNLRVPDSEVRSVGGACRGNC